MSFPPPLPHAPFGRLLMFGVFALALAAPLHAESITVDSPSEVVAATLYPAGAAVTRLARFSVPAGRHEIVLPDLPARIDVDSLRVTGRGGETGFVIEGLSHRIDAPRPTPLPEGERAALLDAIRALEWDRHAEQKRAERARDRRAYIAELRLATSRPGGDDDRPAFIDNAAQWREAWDLMNAEEAAADEEERDSLREIDALDREIAALRERLVTEPPEPPRAIATISITAETAIDDGALEITFLTREAGWSPLYDLRLETADNGADEEAEPILAITRRAAIRQSTGEDWTNVALTLSTARPTGRLAASPPLPPRAWLPEAVDGVAYSGGVLGSTNLISEGLATKRDEYTQSQLLERSLLAPSAEAPEPAPVASAREKSALASYQGAAVVFTLPAPVDAPGDGETRLVRIDDAEQTVEIEARATPAIDPTAYLYASFTNDAAPLLPGRASVYRGGGYFGQTDINYFAPGDLAALPLGPLDTLVIEHVVKREREGEEGVFTVTNNRRLRTELIARNLDDAPVQITLYDAMPYTETDDISLTLVAVPLPSERDVDGQRGAMSWTFDLKGGAEKTIEFGYDISWPDERELAID